MNPLSRAFNAIGGAILVRTGRVGMLGTTGAKMGGMAERADWGDLFVLEPEA